MQTVILGGPALALDNSIMTRHYTISDVEDATQIASLVIDVEAKTRSLLIHKSDYSEEATSAVCKFIKSVFPTYGSVPFTADDGNAVCLAYMLSNNVSSNDPAIVSAWTSFNFEIEMRSQNKDGSVSKIRFLGANMKGIKDIATATSITLTVTAKKK
jgi:fructose-specific phosphotransferase system IIC component